MIELDNKVGSNKSCFDYIVFGDPYTNGSIFRASIHGKYCMTGFNWSGDISTGFGYPSFYFIDLNIHHRFLLNNNVSSGSLSIVLADPSMQAGAEIKYYKFT